MRYESKLIPQRLTGDLRRGGWIVTGFILGDTNVVSDGDNIILRAKSGAGFFDADWRQFFNGHLMGDPQNMTFSTYGSRVQWQAGTMDNLLKGHIQDIDWTEQASPANDHQVTGLQLADAADHILRRHNNSVFNDTTMPDGVITDLDVDFTNSVPLDYFAVGESDNLWRTLQGVGGGEQKGEFYRCWFDRQNKFYYQPAPPFWSVPPTSKGTQTKEHIRGSARVKFNNNTPGMRIGQVSITARKDFQTFYPASFPASPAEGKIRRPQDGVWADSQSKANTLAERLYKWETRAYTLTVEVDPGLVLFGDDGRGLDLGDKVSLTYDGPTEDADTQAGVHLNFSAEDFFVYGVNVRFDQFGKQAKATLTLEQDPT